MSSYWNEKKKKLHNPPSWFLDLPDPYPNTDMDIIHGQNNLFERDGIRKIKVAKSSSSSWDNKEFNPRPDPNAVHPKRWNKNNSNGVEEEVDRDTFESPFAALLLPMLKILHMVNMCPDSFYCEGGTLRRKPGSAVRKILSFIMQVLICIHIYGSSKLLENHMTQNMQLMYRIVTIAYLSFNVTWYINLSTKCLAIEKLLANMRDIEEDFLTVGCQIPKIVNYRIFAWCVCTIYFLLALIFTLIMRCSITVLMDGGFSALLPAIVSTAVTEINLLGISIGLGNSTIKYDPSVMPTHINAAIAVPYVCLSILYDMSWVSGFLNNFMWGICIHRLFKTFYSVIGTRAGAAGNSLQDIRKFNAITFVIDELNGIFSSSIFTAVLSGTLHFSVYIVTPPIADPKGLIPIMNITSFTIFWLQLFAAAMMSHSAHGISKTLKERFRSAETWTKHNGQCNETTQGIIIVFHELSAGNIGFQGLGFFTITYSFIGSVLSLIATYSVVAIQMSTTTT